MSEDLNNVSRQGSIYNGIFEEGSLPEGIKQLPPTKQKTDLHPMEQNHQHYVFQEKSDEKGNSGSLNKELQATKEQLGGGPIMNKDITERKRNALIVDDHNDNSEDGENSKIGGESVDGNEIQKVNQGDIKVVHQSDNEDLKDIVMKQQVDIFLFVNPKSGARKGRKLLEQEFQRVSFELSQGIDAVIHITDLTNPEKKLKAFKELKAIQRKYLIKPITVNFTSPSTNIVAPLFNNASSFKKLVMAVAGGDGTMMTMAQEAISEGIVLDELAFCVLPYGTGNDLSQILGWGKQPKDAWSNQLKSLASLIVNAQEENFNIWDIQVNLREDGDIYQWDSKSRRKIGLGQKNFQRLMCNYFSIGLESRIGLGFDKSRTTSVCGNKCCYAWEGIKKMCCLHKTKKIKNIVSNVTIINHDGNQQILFATDQTQGSEHVLKGNPRSLVCTNINSMMGGQTNMWESGKNLDVDLVDSKGLQLPRQSLKLKAQSSHDDDFLEFATFSSIFHLALGKGRQVAQQRGPFSINFKEPSNGRPVITYFQIDGEFYKIANPLSIEIKLSDLYGHLKVLKNVDEE